MSKIDSGTILIAFFAILFGLTGAWFLRKSLRPRAVVEQPDAPPRRAPQRVTVPLASRLLEPGTTITLDDVALFRMTQDDMSKHGIKNVFMSNPDQIIGKTLAVEIKRGETFDTSFFYPEGVGPGIVDRIEPGQRAVTIKVDPTHALLGFAGAGQQVDVMFRFFSESQQRVDPEQPRERMNSRDFIERRNRQTRFPNQNSEWARANPAIEGATMTLVQGATVLALGKRVARTGLANQVNGEESVSVTLSVQPDDAEKLRLAAGHGELSLTLRHPDDKARVESRPRTIKEVLGIKDPPPLPPVVQAVPQPPRQVIETRSLDIYRGQKRSHVAFSRPADNGSRRFQRWAKQTYDVPVWTDEDQKKLNAFYFEQQRRVEEYQKSDIAKPSEQRDFRQQRSLFNPVRNSDPDANRTRLPSEQRTVPVTPDSQPGPQEDFDLSNSSDVPAEANPAPADEASPRVARFLELHDPGRTQ